MSSSILPLRADNLRYSVDGRALVDGISLTIEPGTFTVVLGPNGAGKSLLLRLLHGMLVPTSGTVTWANGVNGDLRRRQAMVFQRPVLLRRSVEANITYALGALGISRAQRPELVDLALTRAGLADARRVQARLLSVGEQQRLSVARALASEPDIMFLDEPTASLDPASVQRIETLLTDANARGMAIVLVTHDVGQARRLGRDIVFLHGGRLAERGGAAEFFDSPRSDVARAYLAGEIIV
ncbi:MAG: ATP-binding cassette domain-containing protein [Alphaproteobacteria bacterium]